MLAGLEGPSSRTERLARMVQIWGRVKSLDEAIEQIDAVTTADVRQFAANLVSKAPAAMALYGPVSQGPALDALKSRNAA